MLGVFLSKRCPKCPFGQMYTWGIFLVIYLLSWDASLTATINKLQTDLSVAAHDQRSLRRPYLIALSAYSLVVAWLNVAYWVLLLFIAGALVCITAPVATAYWERIVLAFGRPAVLLHSVDLSHVAFHAVVIGASLISMSLSIGFYITDDDLLNRQALTSKMLRVLFTVPAAMAGAYGLYALFCLLHTL